MGIDIYQFRREIRVRRVGCRPQIDLDWADDCHIVFRGPGFEAKHVRTSAQGEAGALTAIELFSFDLIEPAAGEDWLAGRKRTANRGNRICRVEVIGKYGFRF